MLALNPMIQPDVFPLVLSRQQAIQKDTVAAVVGRDMPGLIRRIAEQYMLVSAAGPRREGLHAVAVGV